MIYYIYISPKPLSRIILNQVETADISKLNGIYLLTQEQLVTFGTSVSPGTPHNHPLVKFSTCRSGQTTTQRHFRQSAKMIRAVDWSTKQQTVDGRLFATRCFHDVVVAVERKRGDIITYSIGYTYRHKFSIM